MIIFGSCSVLGKASENYSVYTGFYSADNKPQGSSFRSPKRLVKCQHST